MQTLIKKERNIYLQIAVSALKGKKTPQRTVEYNLELRGRYGKGRPLWGLTFTLSIQRSLNSLSREWEKVAFPAEGTAHAGVCLQHSQQREGWCGLRLEVLNACCFMLPSLVSLVL